MLVFVPALIEQERSRSRSMVQPKRTNVFRGSRATTEDSNPVYTFLTKLCGALVWNVAGAGRVVDGK